MVAIALVALLWAGAVAVLVLVGRRTEARAFARFVPDCIVLFRRLLGDRRLSRGPKLVLIGLLAYLVMPIDLVPDFIPVAGQLDDAIIIALVIRSVLRGAGPAVLKEHWPGPESSRSGSDPASSSASGPSSWPAGCSCWLASGPTRTG